MNREKVFIVPIANLTMEKPLLISNFSLISFEAYHDLNYKMDVSDLSTDEHKKYKIGYISLIDDKKFYLRDSIFELDLFRDIDNARNTTFCIFNLTENGDVRKVLEKTYAYDSSDIEDLDVTNICEQVNIVLDFIILHSTIGFHDRLSLPLLPGLTNDGRKRFYYVEKGKIKQVTSKLVYHIPQRGIGLKLDDSYDYEDNYGVNSSEFYNILFSDRQDEIAFLCRNILHKVNEALYMPSLETSFIFLMSAFEALASNEYIQFKKAKSKILPFITSSKSYYNKFSNFLRIMSENYRTEVIHNGKSLCDIYKNNSHRNVIEDLNLIRRLIITAVINIYNSECYTYDRLDDYRENLKNQFGFN